MPTFAELGRRVKLDYPGAYDDYADNELGHRVAAKRASSPTVQTKYPGDFSDQLSKDEAGSELNRLTVPVPFSPPSYRLPIHPFPAKASFPVRSLADVSDVRPRPIPGTEKLGGTPPPIAPPPAIPEPTTPFHLDPYGKRTLESELERRWIEPTLGVPGAFSKAGRGLRGIIDPSIAEAERKAKGLSSPIYGPGASWLGRRRAALSDIIEGSMEAAAPAVLPLLANPYTFAPTAAMLGTGMAAHAGARKAGEALDLEPETTRLLGNAAGFAAAPVGPKLLSRGLGWTLRLRAPKAMPPKPGGASPPIGESPASPPVPRPEAPPPPMGMSARMRQEAQLGPVAETVPERLMGQTPLQRATREQLGDVYASLVPSGIVGSQVEAMPSQLARLRPRSAPPARVPVPLPAEPASASTAAPVPVTPPSPRLGSAPQPQAPAPTPEAPRASVNVGDQVRGKAGTYRVTQVTDSEVGYEFTNRAGKTQTASMPTRAFERLARQGERGAVLAADLIPAGQTKRRLLSAEPGAEVIKPGMPMERFVGEGAWISPDGKVHHLTGRTAEHFEAAGKIVREKSGQAAIDELLNRGWVRSRGGFVQAGAAGEGSAGLDTAIYRAAKFQESRGGRPILYEDPSGALTPIQLNQVGEFLASPSQFTRRFTERGSITLQDFFGTPHKRPSTPAELYAHDMTLIREAARRAGSPTWSDRLHGALTEAKRTFIESNAPILDAIDRAQREHGFEVLPRYDISAHVFLPRQWNEADF
jgi:hypothetical protein